MSGFSTRLSLACSSLLLLLSNPPAACQSAAPGNTATIPLIAHKPSSLGMPKTAIFASPYWCQPDGTMITEFVGFSDESTATTHSGFVIAVIGADGNLKARIDPAQQVPPGKLDAAYIGTVFVNRDEIFVLLRKSPTTSERQERPNMEKRLFEDRDQRFLIASFAPDGEYKTSIQLDLPFSPLQVAAFDSGSFLIAGVDYGTRKPRVAIVKQDGQVDRMVDLPGDVSSAKQGIDNSREHGTLAEGVTESAITSALVPDGTSVLLIRRGVSGPQYLISDSGETKKIRLPSLKGFERESVQPTTEGLLVTYTRDLAKNKIESRSVLLDSESLKPILNYSFQTPPYSAACSEGTQFVLLQKSKNADFETSVLNRAP